MEPRKVCSSFSFFLYNLFSVIFVLSIFCFLTFLYRYFYGHTTAAGSGWGADELWKSIEDIDNSEVRFIVFWDLVPVAFFLSERFL